MNQPASQDSLAKRSAETINEPGLLCWLIDPLPKRFLLPLTGLWILGLDWLLFSPETMSLGLAMPVAAVVGFLLGGAGVYYTQRRYAGDNRASAWLKSLLAGIVVGLPFPLTGTLVGGWILATSGLASLKNRVLKQRLLRK